MVSPSVCLQLDGSVSFASGSVPSKPYFHRFLLSVSHCAPPSAALTIDGEPAADPWSGFGRDLGPSSPQSLPPLDLGPLARVKLPLEVTPRVKQEPANYTDRREHSKLKIFPAGSRSTSGRVQMPFDGFYGSALSSFLCRVSCCQPDQRSHPAPPRPAPPRRSSRCSHPSNFATALSGARRPLQFFPP